MLPLVYCSQTTPATTKKCELDTAATVQFGIVCGCCTWLTISSGRCICCSATRAFCNASFRPGLTPSRSARVPPCERTRDKLLASLDHALHHACALCRVVFDMFRLLRQTFVQRHSTIHMMAAINDE